MLRTLDHPAPAIFLGWTQDGRSLCRVVWIDGGRRTLLEEAREAAEMLDDAASLQWVVPLESDGRTPAGPATGVSHPAPDDAAVIDMLAGYWLTMALNGDAE